MILSTHAIVGGAIASLFPSHLVLVVAAGFASHFAIDAIPHWDYPLQAIKAGCRERHFESGSPALGRRSAGISNTEECLSVIGQRASTN
jgi:hypothetical protein